MTSEKSISSDMSGKLAAWEPGRFRVVIDEEYKIGQARRLGRSLTEKLGFSVTETALVVTSVSELASNLFFHAQEGGEISFEILVDSGRTGVELISEDSGPGIEDIELALTDGYSTGRGLGGGLPGVRRLMDFFEISSDSGKGTKVLARKWKK